MRQLLTILLVISLTMIGTSALFLMVLVVVKETVRPRQRVEQRRPSLHVLKPLR
jgi:hypothetical protein